MYEKSGLGILPACRHYAANMKWASSIPALALAIPALAAAADFLPPGHRPVPNDAHAITHARIVLEPGKVLTNASLVMRKGRIESVGVDAPIPTDARVWNLGGMTVYPGFIDVHIVQGGPASAVNTSQFTPVETQSGSTLTSGGGTRFFGVPGAEDDAGNQGPGHDLANITPERRVSSQWTPDRKLAEELRELGFTAGCIVPDKGLIRGQSALVLLGEGAPNQLLLKPEVFQHVAFDTDSGKDNAYPRSLMGVIAAWRQAFLDAAHYQADQADYALRASDRSRPALNPALAALDPVIRRTQPVSIEPGSVLMMSRAAQLARELQVEFILVASGQEWRRPDLMASLGVPVIVPVNIPAVPKFTSEDDWNQVSLDALRAWDWAPENPAVLRRLGLTLALTTHGLGDRSEFRKNLRKVIERGLSEDDALAALTVAPAKLCGIDAQVGTIAPGKLANLMVVSGNSYFDPETTIREVWIEGRHYPGKSEPPGEGKEGDKPKPAKDRSTGPAPRIARAPLEGRGPLTEPTMVLVEGATLWTCGPMGRIENGSMLVIDGKISAIGKSVALPEADSAKLIRVNGQGLHVTPGLVDAHSHSMILGGVNEGTLPSTAMVRIGDVINSEASTLYPQLAGGLTTASQLHGSANPIGGQNAIIKLKDGASPDGLRFPGAPEGIKFALGENVKQSNWGEKNVTRFPQTRMGVAAFYVNRFTAARQYQAAWTAHRAKGGLAPRRDLELEAITEILEGRRWIHCHSYRQDEILMFLRTMEQFGVKVGTLQHVLEGYKVADEIARHGAGGSCFSDWWAYKFEVYDAIPHAGSLMHQRGVLVSFNSDSADLARRMNLEAAKAVKYGGTPEEEALKFVTLNPAKQLRIDVRVGSLETGKDADFAVWSRSPLDSTSKCLQTWIEGRKYFDRERAAERTAQLVGEREKLLEKARSASKSSDPAKASEAARAAFFRRALETAHLSSVLNCEDCKLPKSAQ